MSLPPTPFALDPAVVNRYFSIPKRADSRRAFLSLDASAELPDSRRVTEETLAFLENIQGNILSPHKLPYSELLFFRHEGTAAEIRDYFGRAEGEITDALVQHGWTVPGSPAARTFAGFGLTSAGIAAAGCRLPSERNGAFREGMYRRRGGLKDGDWPEPELSGESPAGAIHGLWLLAASTPELLANRKAELLAAGGAPLRIVVEQSGVILRNAAGRAVEPFGFRDGISMPQFFQGGRQPEALVNLPLNHVLSDANDDERGGSFMVYRKLRQDVAAFRKFEAELGRVLIEADRDPNDAARLLVGRRRDGSPLAEAGNEGRGGGLDRFDFKGDREGRRCPFHAHIRKANPRSTVGLVPPESDMELRVQFVRRGLVYGTGGNTRYDPDAAPPDDTGLLFVGYMAEIADQFEIMQANWLSQAEAKADPASHPDPILFGGRPGNRQWSWPELGPGEPSLPLPAFVETRGGSYLFVPPRRWLRRPPIAPAPSRA